ncbi:MAG: hypothetical protein DME90_03450 [Verrucomicrobia bacterium]|nr:MAG: hypothetical protein DME90_03450 [Verrucomicrobiota bacterium]
MLACKRSAEQNHQARNFLRLNSIRGASNSPSSRDIYLEPSIHRLVIGSERSFLQRAFDGAWCGATPGCVVTTNFTSAASRSRFFAESRTITSDSISACATTLFGRVAGWSPTSRAESGRGVSYIVNDHWKINVGALYQHLSNGGQTDPNPSLNLFGPQVGATCSF